MEKTAKRGLWIACELRGRTHQLVRHLTHKKKGKITHYGKEPLLDTEEGRKHLVAAVQRGEPYMAARFGTSEGNALYEYQTRRAFGRPVRFSEKAHREMCMNAGFFPDQDDAICRWCEQETEACADLDMLGVMNFRGEEWIYRSFCGDSKLMPIGGLASSAKGWTWCLEGKKVLIVHPFTDTIRSQYENHREEIFPGTNVLPEFELHCVKAVQTVADAVDDRFADWFEALDYMTAEIEKQDFDVALLGCGAYGFQLASRIKRMGKVAIHMGGSLQILFGIKGSRWNAQYSQMYNDAWVYPSAAETPAGAEKVEASAYWGPVNKDT